MRRFDESVTYWTGYFGAQYGEPLFDDADPNYRTGWWDWWDNRLQNSSDIGSFSNV